MKPKVIVMGIDAFVLPLAKRFVEEGVLPNFAKFFVRASVSEAISVLPPYTPTNWATIATGALPGRHGAGNWTDITVRDLRDRVAVSTFDARTLEAETIWEAASRNGLKSLVITYPGSFPRKVPGTMVVAPLYRGLTGHVLSRGGTYKIQLDPEQIVDLPIRTAAPAGPLIVPTEDGHRVLSEMNNEDVMPRFTVERSGKQLVVRGGYAPLMMELGQWSPWGEVAWTDGRNGSVRFKWLRQEGSIVTLIRSEIYPTTMFTDPPELSNELYQVAGPFVEHPAVVERDDVEAMEAVFEEIQDQVDWYGDVVEYTAKQGLWDLCMFHWHWIDTAQHTFLAGLDPEDDVLPDERAVQMIRRSYQLADHLLGRLLNIVTPNDYLIVVSDHGHVPNRRIVSAARRLVEVGLAKFDEKQLPRQIIDRDRSLVYLLSPHELVVNLQGRNDGGIVAPEHYNQIIQKAMDALLDWKEEGTGHRLVAYAVPLPHQPMLGYFGDRTGDIMFLYNPGYSWGIPKDGKVIGPADGSSNHGAQLPTTRTQRTSNLATLGAMGPTIRQNYQRQLERDGYLSLTDVTPLIAQMLGISPPIHCRGAVPWDFFLS